MDYPEHEKFAHEGLTKALLSALEMAMEGSEQDPKYGWYNGLLFSLEPLSAEQAGKSAFPGGSTVAGHADHILITLEMVQAMLKGEKYEADWGRSWHQLERRQPNEAQWNQLKSGLRQQYQVSADFIRAQPFWREEGLTQTIHNIAHTAYHASAIRQILKNQG